MIDFLTTLDAELATSGSSRRDALRTTGRLGVGAALAAIPFLKPGRARAQSTNGDFGILNYALTLEYLERSFYNQALASGNIESGVRPLFQTIRDDEAAHVDLLRGAIQQAGGDPVDYTDSDFDFGDFVNSYAGITTLAQGLEDTGVRAYKGQAASISDREGLDSYLTVALQIHSVEARHAAAIRRLSGNLAEQGWIPLGQPSADGTPIEAVYGPGGSFPGEENTSQGGVELTTALSGYTATQISAAFDEALDMDTVLAIAGQFITGDEGDGDD